MTEKISPLGDGVDHINIYTRGNTELGRWLSNLATSPFDHPEHGHFRTVEGYWLWLSTKEPNDSARTMFGFEAKAALRSLQRHPREDFKQRICEALWCKLEQHPSWKSKFTQSTLPFRHYYYYGKPQNARVMELKKHDWQVKFLEELRFHMRQQNSVPITAEVIYTLIENSQGTD